MKMFSDKDPAISGLLAGAVYAFFMVLLAYTAAWQGLSDYYAAAAFRSGSMSEAQTAVRYMPENPEAHKTLGELSFRDKDFASAAAAFERAIVLSEDDFLLWLRLGYARWQAGNFDGARTAYQKAIELAPHYSEPNYYMGTMLLESGRSEEAFRYLSMAADRDHKLYPQMLHRAKLTFPDDPLAIESSFQPASLEAKKIVARYLIKHNFMTENVRSFLISDELADGEKNEFIQYLLHKEDFATAREVWLSRLKPEGNAASQRIFDGGFEVITANDESGLGWQVDQKVSATAVARSSTKVHSGANAIHIKFAGDVELGRNILSQLTDVEPGRKYTLQVFVLVPEMISASLPAIVVTDGVTNELLGRSAEFKPTGDKWVEYKCEFIAADSPVVRIGLQRVTCNTIPCPIFGELFLDDLSFLETPNADR